MVVNVHRNDIMEEIFKKIAEIDELAQKGLRGLHFDGSEYRGLIHKAEELREEIRAMQRTN